MSPLRVEILNPLDKQWIILVRLNPKDRPGSLSDNKLDGKRDIYQFRCEADDSKSIISRSKSGIDSATGKTRTVVDFSKPEVVKELGKGESFEMDIKTDKSLERFKYRFTHE